jgi:hypothetical protein
LSFEGKVKIRDLSRESLKTLSYLPKAERGSQIFGKGLWAVNESEIQKEGLRYFEVPG